MTSVPLASLARTVRSRAPRCGPTRVVGVDGPAGAGKSTVAHRLAAALDGAPVVHLDDLYDGWDGAWAPRLVTDLEHWLLEPWQLGRDARYPVFDWAAGRYGAWRDVPAAPVVVMDGVGSGQRPLRPYLSLLLWVEAPGVDVLARVIGRDGAQVAAPMRRWLALEAEHFARERTRSAADLAIDGRAAIDDAVTLLGP